MAIDGLFLHFIKHEIAAFAVGAKVDKIFMPSRYELVLVLRTRTETKRLFISVGGNSPRINFTASNPENPQNPPMICMFFRKQLTGAVIRGLRQQGLDRTLFLDLDATNEIGDRVKRTLVVEIMAQYSNCILLDENGIVLDALKRVDASKSSFREILPQLVYKLPPQQDKADLETEPAQEALARILSLPGKMLSSAVLSSVSGVSPLTARELAYRVTLGDAKVEGLQPLQIERLGMELEALSEMIRGGRCRPCYLKDDNGELLEFSFFPLTLYANAATPVFCGDLSGILDLFCVEREKLQRARSKAEDLYKTVDSLIERTARKINLQREELLSGEEMEEKRRFAELIGANIYALPRGVDHYEIPDYYQDYRIITVPASPELSPSANSQKYYKEYRKAQTAKKVLTAQIEKGAADLD